MFIKGMKYEIRAVARIVLPMFIIFLCAAMLMSAGFILDGRVFHFAQAEENEGLLTIFHLAEILIGIGLFILMVAINISVFVMVIRRFYTSFFTDEGYLTFTLPLTTDCHLMIKIASMFFWILSSSLVTMIGALIIFGGISIGYPDIMNEVLSEIRYVMQMALPLLENEIRVSRIVLSIISMIISFVFQSMLLYFSITLGCMIFRKNRLVGAILSIFLVDSIYSFFSSFGTSILSVFGMVSQTAFTVAYIIGIVISVAGIIALYCAMKYILERKLNLD
ncbi:MAG: hypothetical protein IJA86_04540 [Clostridia bacterium]|nr:hypothetical protein [Clostridia bacterium]